MFNGLKIFDYNVHLYSKDEDHIDDQIKEDTELTSTELTQNLNRFKTEFDILEGANIMMFNEVNHHDDGLKDFFQECRNRFETVSFTQLFDFRSDTRLEDLRLLANLGVNFIKFHCYVQSIEDSEYDKIIEVSKEAEKLNVGISVDCSYGTTGLYKYDNLKLLAALADNIKQVPIIALHGGGARVFDMYLIADMAPNIYVETSLSLDFYKGSSLVEDFKWVYKKLGSDRIVFASDYPYEGVSSAIESQFEIFKDCGFGENEIENIYFNNALKLF